MQGLEHQRGFADARIAADEHQGTGHQAAAQHPVEFVDAGGLALFVDDFHGVNGHRLVAFLGHNLAAGRRRSAHFFG